MSLTRRIKYYTNPAARCLFFGCFCLDTDDFELLDKRISSAAEDIAFLICAQLNQHYKTEIFDQWQTTIAKQLQFRGAFRLNMGTNYQNFIVDAITKKIIANPGIPLLPKNPHQFKKIITSSINNTYIKELNLEYDKRRHAINVNSRTTARPQQPNYKEQRKKLFGVVHEDHNFTQLPASSKQMYGADYKAKNVTYNDWANNNVTVISIEGTKIAVLTAELTTKYKQFSPIETEANAGVCIYR